MKLVLLILTLVLCAWPQSPGPGKEIGSGAGDIGKGAGAAGKGMAVGTVKGTRKIGQGVGKAVQKLF